MSNTPARLAAPQPPQLPGLAVVARAAPGGRLAPTVKAAVQAVLAAGPAVRDQDEIVVQANLIAALSAALFNLNHASSYADGPNQEPGTAIELLALEVAKMVQRRFPAFKSGEVVEAIRRGSAGDWNPDASKPLYLSVPTVQSWLTRYRDETRAQALAAIEAADQAFAKGPDGRPLPVVEDFPAWHLQTIRANLPQLLGLVELANGPKSWPADDPDVVVWGKLVFDWLETLGVLGSFAPVAERRALLDVEVARLAALPVTAALDGRHRQGEITSFAKLLADQSKSLATHPVMSEAKANCRRALLLAWLRSWPTLRDCEAYVVSHWATAYFTYYQTRDDATPGPAI